MPKILVIDDESTILENLKFVLELEDFEVLTAPDGISGIKILKNQMNEIDTVITDMKMPKMSGIEVLRSIKELYPQMSVIILTGHGDIQNAISAMKEDAFEYLNKPVNADELIIAINNAIIKKNLLLENKKLQDEIIKKNEYLQDIHFSAQKILLNMIPKKLPHIEGFTISSKYISCDEVGGDMFDIFELDGFPCFYIFDVSSHGILASVITIILKSFFDNLKLINQYKFCKEGFISLISDLNYKLCSNTAYNIFATMFIGAINRKTNRLLYISAGHIPQYIIRGQSVITLESTGTVLGVFEDAIFECNELQLYEKDKIITFTDGIIETWNNDKLYGHESLIKLFKNLSSSSIENIIDQVITSISDYSDMQFCDDITILGIERNS